MAQAKIDLYVKDLTSKIHVKMKLFTHKLEGGGSVMNHLSIFKEIVADLVSMKVKLLRTDNGGEFCSDAFNDYCREEGILRHHTIPYTPQQNGVAERMNRTIISRARCMLSNARMNRHFWAEAANVACYLINRSPSISLNKKTPIEVWSGMPADYSQFSDALLMLMLIIKS